MAIYHSIGNFGVKHRILQDRVRKVPRKKTIMRPVKTKKLARGNIGKAEEMIVRIEKN